MENIIKSEIRIVYVILHIFLIAIVCSLLSGMIYDLGATMPSWLYIFIWMLLIGYPLFTIYAYLCIPRITIDNDKISSKSIRHSIEMPINTINSVKDTAFKNRIYSIGQFCIIKSEGGNEVEIPYKLYKNESKIIHEVLMIKERI